jgi:dipeptidyl-peptidase-4
MSIESNHKKNNMKNIFLAIALLIVVGAFAQQKDMTLEQAVLSRPKGLTPKNMVGLKWLEDANNYVFTEANQLVIKSALGQEVARIGLEKFSATYPELKAIPRISSITTTALFFEHNKQIIHFDYLNGKELSKISFDENAANKDFSKTAQAIAYTLDNNLYIAKALEQQIAVTNNKDKNIVSGQAIHRYEFGIHKGTFWSPKGNFLAFYQKDETNVSEYPLIDVTTYPASVNKIKYPMAGQKSERAKIGIYNMNTQETIYLYIDTQDEHFLTSLVWTPDEKYVFVGELNRGQNHLQFNRYEVASGKTKNPILREK